MRRLVTFALAMGLVTACAQDAGPATPALPTAAANTAATWRPEKM